jgi:hypothetical protein
VACYLLVNHDHPALATGASRKGATVETRVPLAAVERVAHHVRFFEAEWPISKIRGRPSP